MARSVDEVELVVLPIGSGVGHPHGLGFNGYSPLALEVHRVENLLNHISIIHRVGGLKETVCKSGFSMVDVGDNAEVSYVASVIRTHELMVAYGILTQQASGVDFGPIESYSRPNAN